MLRARTVSVLACQVACLGLASVAAAADPSPADKETSRALYAQGIQALDAHDYAAAEKACGGAHALVKAPTSAACWARALEGLGRLVEARDEFLEAARFPIAADEPAVFASARTTSRAEADSLAKRIPSLTLVVQGPSDLSGLRVNIDGASVPPETALLPRKLNPGGHSITVVSRGFEPTTVDVQLSEAEDRRVELVLHAQGVSPPPTATAPTEPPPQSTSHGPPLIAIVVGGVGVAGVVVGVATALAATSKHTTLQGECSGSTCPPSAQGDLDSFHTLRTVSAVGYVVGALGIAGGVALWLLAPKQADAASARLWLSPGAAGVAGAF
jgi:hypothetical protein